MAADCSIVDIRDQSTDFIEELAKITYSAFQEPSPSWLPTVAAAREELRELLEPGRQSRALVNTAKEPLGWIGTIPQSGGRVWEIHPIIVRKGVVNQVMPPGTSRFGLRLILTAVFADDSEDVVRVGYPFERDLHARRLQ